MKSLYLLLNIASLSLPLLFSLAMRFFKKEEWLRLSFSSVLTALVFLVWDFAFTYVGVWGFNPKYHYDILLLGLPMEEILFFFCIPFSSLFIHFLLVRYRPSLGYREWIPSWILTATGFILIFLGVWHHDLWYTFIDLILAGVLLVWGSAYAPHLLRSFLPSFVIILIPFFVVNGILTGGFTPEPVVWYNNAENLGIRLGSIPVEDIAYAFSMLFLNLSIFDRLGKATPTP